MQNSYLQEKKKSLFFIFIRLITLKEQWGPEGRFSEDLVLWGEALFAFVWRFVVGRLCGFCWILFGFWVGFCFNGWSVGMLDTSSLVYSKQSHVLLWEFYLVLLQVQPVPSNKTVRMRTKFLMLSIICLLVEILILSFTYRVFPTSLYTKQLF